VTKEQAMVRRLEDLNSGEVDPLDSDSLRKLMHERGLNMRNVGRLAMEAKMNHTKELAVIEVVARCAKLLIRDVLTVLAETSPSEKRFTTENIKKCILHYLHEIFG